MDLDERRIKLREAMKANKVYCSEVGEAIGISGQYVSVLLKGSVKLKNERLTQLEKAGYRLIKKAQKQAERAQKLANKPILEKRWVVQELRWKDCRRIVVSEQTFTIKGKAERAAKKLQGSHEIFFREGLVER